MRRLYTINLLSGILIMILGAVLSGCSQPKNISRDLLNIPHDKAQNISHEKIFVYGVAFEQVNTVLSVRRFGIQASGDGTINVSNEITHSTKYKDIKTASMSELNEILNRHGFSSLKAFTEKYQSAEPIIPKSIFKALPDTLGKELSDFSRKIFPRHGR